MLIVRGNDPRIDSLPVLSILEVNLKIAHRGLGPRGIELPGAIMASYPWQVHPFYAFGRRLSCWWSLARRTSSGVDSGVLHCAFEVISRVLG